MKSLFKVTLYIFLFIGSSILLFVGANKNDNSTPQLEFNEAYNPTLKNLNSIQKLEYFMDKTTQNLKINPNDTAQYVFYMSEILKSRFYHGLSNYSLSDNWIAVLLGKISWSHFTAIVNPNDIVQHSEALCSQQAIVFIELLKRKNITYRTVGLGPKEGPGHFLCEVYYDNAWHLFDIDKEPQWYLINDAHKDMNYYINQPDQLYKTYKYRMTRAEFDHLINKVSFGAPNEFPAKNMLLFHRVTKVFTYILPAIFLLLFIWNYRKSKVRI